MNRSDSINELLAALSKFQGELSNVNKNSKGYGYEYADLAAVLDVARPLLAKNGLTVSQLPAVGERDQVALETILGHASGQWISSVFTMPVEQGKSMSAAQSVGSVITYARRYSLAAALGIAQADDDGAGDKKPPKGAPPAANKVQVQRPTNSDNQITEKQRKMLWASAKELWGDNAESSLRDLLTRHGYSQSTDELTRDQGSEMIGHLISLKGGVKR